MSTAVTPINGPTVEYFSDSHDVQSMDSATTKVQLLDSELRPNRLVERGPRKLISDALRDKLSAGDAEKLAGELTRIAVSAKSDRDRVAAITEITDRTEGKAVQNVRHAGVFLIAAPGEDVLNQAFGALAPAEDE